MSRSSSISGSKSLSQLSAKTYLTTVLGIVGVALFLTAATSVIAIRYNLLAWQFAMLFDYQTRKLESGPQIDVLLVGDSSLGNAIDAKQWSKEGSIDVENVALTGVYGYAGSLEMIRRAVVNRGVKTVLIVQAADMMTRRESFEGALFTASSYRVFLEIPLGTTIPWILSKDLVINFLTRILNGRPQISESMRSFDYVPQYGITKFWDSFRPLPAAAVNPDNEGYLVRIADLCRAEKIACFYVHGPVAEPMCDDQLGYYTRANQIIQDAGLSLLQNTPPCVPKEQIGDTQNHVAPQFKAQYTDLYRELLRSKLASLSDQGQLPP